MTRTDTARPPASFANLLAAPPWRGGGGARASMPRPTAGRAGLFAALLVGLADWLLYASPLGLSLTLFVAALGAAGMAVARPRAAALAALAFGLTPMLIAISSLSVLFGLAGAAAAVLFTRRNPPHGVAATAGALVRFAAGGPLRLPIDLFRLARARRRLGAKSAISATVARWGAPVALSFVFICLFALANPLFEAGLEALDPLRLLSADAIARMIFWTFCAVLVWPFLRPARGRVAQAVAASPVGGFEGWLGPASLIRSLALFNLIFAAQTVMDAAYLAGGATLPDGMTYAEYAHRGAYPLIAVAMLSAAFALSACRGKAMEGAGVRPLVYLWLFQNGLLVASSIYRLQLYVEAYGLTHLRLSAFIWMALVAIGLGLIVARIALARSGRWLIGANLIAAAATLYMSCFINFAATIADYNVEASLTDPDRVTRIDLWHLMGLGAHAIPAVDRLLTAPSALTPDERKSLRIWRADCDAIFTERMSDWRAFTINDHRLADYLASHHIHNEPATAPPPPEGR